MIKVLVVDDHELVRAGITMLIDAIDDIHAVAEAGTGHEAVRLCEKEKPDVVLLDLDLPDIDGFEVTQQILAMNPDVKILVLTMHDSEEFSERIMKMGAAGYIIKGISPQELPNAIRKVYSGGKYVSSSIMEKMAFSKIDKDKESPLQLLSDRELQVLIRLAKGGEQSEIADELCISISTVGTYRQRIFDKLGFRNIAELVHFSIRNKVIDNF